MSTGLHLDFAHVYIGLSRPAPTRGSFTFLFSLRFGRRK